MCTHAYDLPVVAILPVCGNGEYVCSERNTEVLGKKICSISADFYI